MMRPFGGKSITLRLTLLFAVVSTSVLLALGVTVGSLVEHHFEEMDIELLEGKLELIGHALADPNGATLPARLNAALVGHHGLSVAVWAVNGTEIYSHGKGDFPLGFRKRAEGASAAPVQWTGGAGRPFRGLSAQLPGPSGPVVVAVSTELDVHEHFMRSFNLTLWSIVALAALASGLLGWGAARRGLAPLREICRDAAGITADRLDRRLAAEAFPMELAEVARTLNEMFGRLEDSFRRLSDFSSDLAHELRTPVSNLLTQTQVTLSKARTDEEYRDVLASNAEEFERLSRTIADMLFLAKAENDLVIPALEPVDLRAEADGLLEFYEALAEESGVELSVEGEATVSGDKLMLRRAMGNLLSNAIRHTPRGGRIGIHIAERGDAMATLSISNTGPTIPAEHLSRLFDRFYRADPSRHRDSEGAGLGLAITRSIMRAHGGDASARSADGVTVFELSLPV